MLNRTVARSVAVAFAVAVCVLSQACGGGGNKGGNPAGPAPIPVPAGPPVPTVSLPGTTLYSATFTDFAMNNGGRGAFSVPGAGTLHVAVEWAPTASSVGAVITDQTCTTLNGAFGGGCTTKGAPQTGGQVPKVFEVSVTAAFEAYVYIVTLSGAQTSGTTRVSFVAATGGPGPTPTPTATPTPRPTPPPGRTACPGSPPPGPSCSQATGQCNDNTYTCSTNNSGTCSSHNGLKCVFCPGPLCQ